MSMISRRDELQQKLDVCNRTGKAVVDDVSIGSISTAIRAIDGWIVLYDKLNTTINDIKFHKHSQEYLSGAIDIVKLVEESVQSMNQ